MPLRPRRTLSRFTLTLAFGLALLAYLALWPVPIDPVAWDAPTDRGFVGDFAVDSTLAGAERIPLGDHPGPESVARDAQGRLYAATLDGSTVRLDAEGRNPSVWARTGGRPLGLAFGGDGTLYVADGIRGLLAVDTTGQVTVLADLDASTLDIIEHGGHGRLLEWDPRTRAVRAVRVVAAGRQFANGVAVTTDGRAVLMTETGAYRIVRVELDGPARGRVTPIVENLPGFPDNISRDAEGRFWVALFAPRKGILDRLARYPALRKVIVRIPSALQPKPARYAHLISIDESGRVMRSVARADLERQTVGNGVLAAERGLARVR